MTIDAKSHFMAVLHLLLQNNSEARAIKELAAHPFFQAYRGLPVRRQENPSAYALEAAA